MGDEYLSTILITEHRAGQFFRLVHFIGQILISTNWCYDYAP